MQCWSESCCQKPRQVVQHWLKGVGKDMTNGELGGFFKTMHCPKCPYNREHWDNCNKVDQVSQLFFSRIVGLHNNLQWSTLQSLQDMLYQSNIYVATFKTVKDKIKSGDHGWMYYVMYVSVALYSGRKETTRVTWGSILKWSCPPEFLSDW